MSRNLPSLNALLAFEAAARHLSFKKAAEELFVTQSAISHRIKSMEELLEAPLFVRHPQSVELTLRGSEYFEQVAFFLSGIENSTQKVRRNQLRGPLYIQASPAFASFWLLPRLIRFNQTYPDIDVNLMTIATPESPAVCPFDLRINCAWEEPPEKCGEPLMDSPHVPVCHPDFLADGRILQSAEDLFDYRFIKTVDPWDDWHVWFNSQGITDFSGLKGPVMENIYLALVAAEQGQGIAIAPIALVQEKLEIGQLVVALDVVTTVSLYFTLTSATNWRNNPRILAFRAWMDCELGANSGLEPIVPPGQAGEA